ncbi:FecCD family ABC transporter permease [Amorphoplanes digitatis]|uniref:Iron complex transport system permease protein n=1 Tax=Actinoplanes digitatis TaxID=1868 RepID=A0A7W7I0A7_9ACTN|nr:iron chelate uptake ABC transporter family permease subunit [Actinoplanes digitatis]MBB4764065.1 iron complex transport system permease protein [Actinoplanes digitatis]GID97343.1 ABC transporter permease [Actinoplanes digitatis]
MSAHGPKIVLRGGGLSVRLHVRALVAGAALALAALAVALVNLTSGDFDIPVADVLRSLAGRGDAGTDFIVYELRLPRVLITLLVGAALGGSGSVFQGLTRNPLGSPDFVGLTVGAATGALVVMLILDGGGIQVAAGAIIGCLLCAVAIYLLAFRRGMQPFRLVLMGIGVSALLEAANSYLIYRGRLDEALAAQVWLLGSVNGRGWTEVVLVAVAVIVLLPVVLHHGRHLSMLALGDEIAVLHGVPVGRSRAVLAFAAVGLSAGATAAAGPIAFVALAAPPLAARLARSPHAGILPSAAMGAALLTAGDWAAQHALPGHDIPVGVITAALGGAYLTWLLFRERRTRG